MMAAVNRWMPVFALALSACGTSELPLPSIVSVEPPSMAADESILLTVALEGSLPLTLDYGQSTAELFTSKQVLIAGRGFEILETQEQGQRLLAEIPPGLPVGLQELRVGFTDGRQAVLENGFEVKPPLDISSLLIRPVSSQVRLRPFTLILQALGPDAELFRGRVRLSTNQGTITPSVSGPFTQGVRLQEVIVDAPAGSYVAITVEDYGGRSVTSNDFRILQN